MSNEYKLEVWEHCVESLQFSHLLCFMNRLLSQTSSTLGPMWGTHHSGRWQLFVPAAAEQTQSPAVHMLTDMQLYCGAKDNTSVLLCPWSPPGSFVKGGWKPVTTSCPRWPSVFIHRPQKWWLRGTRCHDPQAAHQPLQNNGASLLALCVYAVTGLLCLASIWSAVTESRLIITPALSLLEN